MRHATSRIRWQSLAFPPARDETGTEDRRRCYGVCDWTHESTARTDLIKACNFPLFVTILYPLNTTTSILCEAVYFVILVVMRSRNSSAPEKGQ